MIAGADVVGICLLGSTVYVDNGLNVMGMALDSISMQKPQHLRALN
jgi:hypothetical protein